jgi:ABC-type microcin C transport system duplicated ATPase subunit YejF
MIFQEPMTPPNPLMTIGRQITEVAIAVASLNRMLELGRPEYVRLT